MLIGILFVLAGLLIALYPPLLSMIVATLLLFVGISLISMSYYFKKASRDIDNPFMNFFIRF